MQKIEVNGNELDRIGRLGETYFEQLCLKAHLKCSRVEPDRTGKDFVVELDLARQKENESLDMRAPPIQVVVQVKTILSKNNSTKIALSVAERLAKDLRPAVIFILKIDAFDIVQSTHLVHLINHPLERILSGLRKASISPTSKLNKKTISYNATQANRISENATDFHAEITALPGKDMLSYADEKKRQLHETGYDQPRYIFNVTFEKMNPDEMLDGFMGFREMPVLTALMFERRFQIDLPMQRNVSGTIRIQPQASGHGTLNIKGVSSNESVLMTCEYTHLPRQFLGGSNFAVSFKSSFGTFVLKGSSWTYTPSKDFDLDTKHGLSEWRDFLTIGKIISGGTFANEFHIAARADSLSFTVDGSSDEQAIESHRKHLSILSLLDIVAHEASLEKRSFSLTSAIKQYRELRLLVLLIRETTASFECEGDVVPVGEFSGERGGYMTAFEIGDELIGVFLPIKFTINHGGSMPIWHGTQTGAAILEDLAGRDREQSFEKFRRKMMRASGVSAIFTQQAEDLISVISAPLLESRSTIGQS